MMCNGKAALLKLMEGAVPIASNDDVPIMDTNNATKLGCGLKRGVTVP